MEASSPSLIYPGSAGFPVQSGAGTFLAPPPIVNEEIFIVIVSKHSPSCNQIFKNVQFIAPHLNTRILEIDHPMIRQKVVDSGKIKTVPCIVLLYPNQQKMQFFEGVDALRLIQQLVQQVQQKIQALRPVQDTPITQIMPPQPIPSPMAAPVRQQVDPYYPESANPQDLTATMMERNINPPMPPQVQGHEQMSASSVTGSPQGVSEPSSLADIPGGTMIDDGSDLGYAFDIQPASGMTSDQIFGANDAGMVNREKERKSKVVHSKMDQMIREREEFDRANANANMPPSARR